jgi:hypothetical protein
MNSLIPAPAPASGSPIAAAGQARRLGVIYNTHSGHHRKRWGNPGFPGIPVHEANNPDEIGEALLRLAGEGVDLLAVAGGDGTVQSVLTHLLLGGRFERMPLLALVPTGSTNMTGGDVGLVKVRRNGWQRLLDWARQPGDWSQHVTYRPVLKIEPGGGRAPFCGMFFGAGAIYQAVEHTQRKFHSMGLRGDVGPGLAFLRFVKAIANQDRRRLSPVQARLIDGNGIALEQEYILLLASTLERLLLHMRPFWGTEDGPVHWTAVEFGARSLLWNLPAVCRGNRRNRLMPAQGYHSHSTQRLELHLDEGYIVDGEFFRASRDDGPVVLGTAGTAAFLHL